ncbi:MAG: hypothetical protein F6K00_26790 [Leptolyngbya sp. SIOISBB]|nr:hypothetical protein [Leptolyngbya sp. SIOISBB]
MSHSKLAHVDYAFVSTTYGAQGKSTERVIGSLDRHVGRESFYATVSRVKHDLRLYASEDLDILVKRAIKSRVKENPSDAGLPPFRPEDTRLQHRESYKAIDILPDSTSRTLTRSHSKVAKEKQNGLE